MNQPNQIMAQSDVRRIIETYLARPDKWRLNAHLLPVPVQEAIKEELAERERKLAENAKKPPAPQANANDILGF